MARVAAALTHECLGNLGPPDAGQVLRQVVVGEVVPGDRTADVVAYLQDASANPVVSSPCSFAGQQPALSRAWSHPLDAWPDFSDSCVIKVSLASLSICRQQVLNSAVADPASRK